MASDAYMELQDPAVWGETLDEQFGMTGRKLGAFEIFGFDFNATSNREDESDKPAAPATGGGTGKPVASTGGGSLQGTATNTQPVIKTFSIKKFIDKASPDLLVSCCKAGMKDAKKIAWAIISVRETGDFAKMPYLTIEFQGLWVESFGWSLTPGAEASSASTEESVTFSFETILVKYNRQEESGKHSPVKINGFNRVRPGEDVPPLPPVQQLQG